MMRSYITACKCSKTPEFTTVKPIHRHNHHGDRQDKFRIHIGSISDNHGRRTLLLLGTIGMSISLACLDLGTSYLQRSQEKPLWAIDLWVVAVCADFSFFSIGIGPITWVYSSEIFPMRLRAQGLGMAISVNRIVSGIVSMTFLSVSNAITFGGMFFVLSRIMVVGSVFFYCYFPETKGKSLEEIETMFEDKHPGS